MKIQKYYIINRYFLTQTKIFIMNVYFTPVTMANQGEKIDWG